MHVNCNAALAELFTGRDESLEAGITTRYTTTQQQKREVRRLTRRDTGWKRNIINLKNVSTTREQ